MIRRLALIQKWRFAQSLRKRVLIPVKFSTSLLETKRSEKGWELGPSPRKWRRPPEYLRRRDQGRIFGIAKSRPRRIQILTEFRRGKFDCLVGVNLLREGLDLPEVTFIGILDADKEGFLRSEMALIQTIGRAARNTAGRVILYADEVTGSMERAMKETARRRALQIEYNTRHGITPQTIIKAIKDITDQIQTDHAKAVKGLLAVDEAEFAGVTDAAEAEKLIRKVIKRKEAEMEESVKVLDFETAAILRDEVKALEERIG